MRLITSLAAAALAASLSGIVLAQRDWFSVTTARSSGRSSIRTVPDGTYAVDGNRIRVIARVACRTAIRRWLLEAVAAAEK